jgi:purine-binding chemotaxis protein CheW
VTGAPARWSARAAELRLSFDQSFAAPRRLDPPGETDLLGIRLAGQPYAIRLSEIAGLFADKAVTPMPSRAPDLLGVAGFRGAILPVYDLGAVLGHRAAPAPRWLAIAAAAPLAIAFEGFDGQLRIACEAILAQPDAGRAFVRELAQGPGIVRPLVHLPSVLDAIKAAAQGLGRTKER